MESMSMPTLPISVLNRAPSAPRTQRGFVLVVALIVLVAMSLTAAALMRSVDTGAGVAGNIAFRESAISSMDAGIERAVEFLAVNRGKPMLNAPSAADGYFPATTNTTDWSRYDWSAAKRVAADASGNQIDYIIERMCEKSGVPFGANPCVGKLMTLDDLEVGNSKSTGAAPYTVTEIGYRITGRVTDPKNSATYIQVFAY
jgi:type IV pilus assembly protein PilX